MFGYMGERTQLLEWGEHRGPDGLVEYRQSHNHVSIDGLGGLKLVHLADD